MRHRANAIKANTERTNKAGLQLLWNCYASGLHHRSIAEEMIHPDAVTHVLCHIISNSVPNIALVTIVKRNIIWHLSLEEVCRTTLTIPLNQILKCVLHGQSIKGHVISIDLCTDLTWILLIVDFRVIDCMICAPQPQVVTDHITRIEHEHLV